MAILAQWMYLLAWSQIWGRWLDSGAMVGLFIMACKLFGLWIEE